MRVFDRSSAEAALHRLAPKLTANAGGLLAVVVMLAFALILPPPRSAREMRNAMAQQEDVYPWHRNIVATVFWIGEPADSDTNYITNAVSAWDDHWIEHYGGVDDYQNRNGYFPAGFTPKENPFYLDLPYNDFDDQGNRRADVVRVPWYGERIWGPNESVMKNRWVRIVHNGTVCYGQIEDAGPRYYDDTDYVFGKARPRNRDYANGTGMDVSPALRDCLGFTGLNNADNVVDWQFVDASAVPDGPWKQIVTTSNIDWSR
jgi:hypothetical protein